MRGDVISIDPSRGQGIISGEDGARYAFNTSTTETRLQVGDRVDFVALSGVATDIVSLGSNFGGANSPVEAGPEWDPTQADYNFGKAMFSFEGRLRRQHFWISWLILFAGGFVLGLIPFLGVIISLVLIWPNVAIQVKRLHDMGKTGWLALIPFAINLVCIVGIIMTVGIHAITNAEAIEAEDSAAMMAMMMPVLGFAGVFIVAGFGWLIWIGVVDSEPGENRFGPNPKYRR